MSGLNLGMILITAALVLPLPAAAGPGATETFCDHWGEIINTMATDRDRSINEQTTLRAFLDAVPSSGVSVVTQLVEGVYASPLSPWQLQQKWLDNCRQQYPSGNPK